MNLSLFTVSGIWISLATFIIILFLIKYGREKIHFIWACFNLSVFVWGIASILFTIETQYERSLLFAKIAHIGVIFIPVLFFHFVLVLGEHRDDRLLKLVYLQAFAFLALVPTNLFIKIKYFTGFQFYYCYANYIYTLFFILWGAIVGYGHWLLLELYRKSYGRKKLQVSYLFLGMVVGFSGGVTNFLPSFGIKIYPYGNLTIPIYCFIVSYAILRFQILDISVAVTRAGIFLTLYTAVLGLPFYIGYKSNSWVLSTSFAVILASLGPLAYRALQEKAENILLAEQRRYQKILLQAANGMAKEHQLDRLLKLIVYIVKRTVRISFAASFINDKDNKIYKLKAFRGDNNSIAGVMDFSYDHNFINYLKGKDEPFLAEEMPPEIRASINLPFNPSLIVPSSFENDSLGFLLLGEKQNKKPYTSDDLNVFKILSHQSALAVENCIFVQEFKKAQERLFQAEKLASIGGMADGLAHQIKNRLNLFSVGAGEIKNEVEYFSADHFDLLEKTPDLKDSFSYVIDSAEKMVLNVKKTNAIIQGILNFARIEEKDTGFGQFSLKEVIDSAREVMTVKHGTADLPITFVTDNDVLYGVKAQITESIFNILDNAFEATREKREYYLPPEERNSYNAEIRVTLTNKGDSSVITIVDNGIGIKDENKRRIFAPFFTTKASTVSGSGIGMYVVKRMIEENHKGRISFDSTYGEGTRFTIELPNRPVKREQESLPDGSHGAAYRGGQATA